MAEAKTREQLETDWWDAWWRADFSWAGLKNKQVGKHGGLSAEKTLLDYWRCDPATDNPRDNDAMWAAGELVDCDGTVFHIAHLPPMTKSGVKTWKAKLEDPNWKRLNALLAQRIDVSAETKVGSFGLPEGPDGRAQFVGAVLRGGLPHPKGDESALHLNAVLTATLDWADYAGRRFGPGTHFVGAIFCGGASFDDANFSGDAHFDGATFSTHASFDDANFSGDAGFTAANFSGNANFDDAKFSGDAGFTAAKFSGIATFNDAKFSGNANFNDANFFGDAVFSKATFNAKANFDKSVFGGVLQFIGAKVKGAADFEGGRCGGRVWFDDSKFAGTFRVAFREFRGRTYLDDVEFFGPMEFQVATFEKFVSFDRVQWPKAARDWHGAFTGAQFRSLVSFEGAGFQALAAFDGAIVESKIWIAAADEEEAKRTFDRELEAAIKPDPSDGADFEEEENEKRKVKDGDAARLVTRKEIDKYVKHTAPENRLQQLEGGCRVLKQAMGWASDKSREQMFYRFELQARRKRRNRRGMPFGEWLFSYLYGGASDYGASIVRPLIALAALIVACAGLFWLFAAALDQFTGTELRAGPLNAQIWSALDFSWGNVFRPLSALSENAAAVRDGSMIDKLLTEAGDGYAWGVRLLATIQSLLAIVLAFLFALAVRRRFQIN